MNLNYIHNQVNQPLGNYPNSSLKGEFVVSSADGADDLITSSGEFSDDMEDDDDKSE